MTSAGERGDGIWHVQVFGGAAAAGNATGIVLLDDERDRTALQRAALALGFPDTGFAWPAANGVWRMRAFSPVEELAVCTQATLALAAVLHAQGLVADASIEVATEVGPVTVRGDPARPGERYWVYLAVGPAATLQPADRTGRLFGAGFAAVEALIGFGRNRLYVEGDDTDALGRLRADPADVVALCAALDATAVCPFARNGPDRIALRVFTTSLGGAEDRATGGAAAGLPAYLALRGEDVRDRHWHVTQGVGPAATCGELHIRTGTDASTVSVGGTARILAAGLMRPAVWADAEQG